jgi:hypothetical protein
MGIKDAAEPTPTALSRRQILLGAGVGAGMLVAGHRTLTSAHAEPAGAGARLRGTMSGTRRVGAARIAPGETLRFDPTRNTTLELSGNLVVEGRLMMRPDHGVRHVLRFVDVDESAFVGGGMDPIDSDVGLWVMGSGSLNIQGTEKRAWNREGDHDSWTHNDDLVVAPVAAGDFTAKRFRKGSWVPRYHGRRAEVLNLTRNARIEGTPGGRAHVFIRSTEPQTIRHAALRHLGPRQPGGDATESVLGRYGLHFHHCHDGSRRSVVEGVVVRDCGGHAFVPHMSHGITIRDSIAYDVFDEAYWWDPNDETNDLLIDRCVAASVHHDPEIHGYRLAGFLLGDGRNMDMHRCVAFGVMGNNPAAGFVWPEAASGIWGFRDNVAHNNGVAGIFVWQNVREPHLIKGFTAYNNGDAGIIHGAYLNAYHYRDLDLRDQANAIELHAAGRPDLGGRPLSWVDVKGGALFVTKHNLPAEAPALFRRCPFPGGVTIADGQGDPGPLDFVDCGLELGDFDVTEMHPETVVRVQRANGSAFELTTQGTREIPGYFPY